MSVYYVLEIPFRPSRLLFASIYTPPIKILISRLFCFRSCMVLLLLSKVTQKHFRQSFLPSKVLLRPAGGFYTILIGLFLSAVYRCVTRSCYKVINKNLYHRKLSGIPFLSRYSCRDFSLSSSVGAVLYLLYNSRFAIVSSFFSNPFLISSASRF